MWGSCRRHVKTDPLSAVEIDPLPRPWLESSRGGSEVLSVEDWAEIRRLHRSEGMPIKAIARVVGCSKNTVKAALAAQGPPRYRRSPRG
jgi:hypothetical protein